MKKPEKYFLITSILIQLGVSLGLLWGAYGSPLRDVLSSPASLLPPGPQPELQMMQLVREYQHALGLTQAILSDAALALLCSAALTIIAMYVHARQKSSR